MTVARRLLTHVALGTAFVVAVVTAVTYDLVYDALEQRDLRHLDTYVAERAQREEARFQQVQSNLTVARAQFLSQLDVRSYAEWPGDASNRRIASEIRKHHDAGAKGSVRVSAVTWELEEGLNFYRRMYGLGWMQPVDRSAIALAGAVEELLRVVGIWPHGSSSIGWSPTADNVGTGTGLAAARVRLIQVSPLI